MRIGEIEKAVRNGFASEDVKARIMSEGPVALSEALAELEAREAARSLTGRTTEINGEIAVQRSAAEWG